jgi:hypothetical protein
MLTGANMTPNPFKLLVEQVELLLGHDRVVVRLKDSLEVGMHKEKESRRGSP